MTPADLIASADGRGGGLGGGVQRFAGVRDGKPDRDEQEIGGGEAGH